ncbi:MAG TPA: PadR family transcriptional regulator [Candidatus Bathyarchaeia archaeon]|nr:PadR family transcriptional regulator [Candidatus Bathyarchaeia archaeon]
MDSQLLAGTLEMLVLQVVSPEPSYGYAITQEVLQRSRGYLELKEGSLYPTLHRLEREGLLESYWVDAGPKRRRKYYRVTARGLEVLEHKMSEWRRFSSAVDGVIGASVVMSPSRAIGAADALA